MKTSKRKLGDLGEDLASEFLSNKGQIILERNWRGSHLEVDIISLDKDGLHFVEVKSRTAPIANEPEENVGREKQRRLIKAAEKYLNEVHKEGISPDQDVYFDIVSIIFEGEKVHLEYFPEAFIPINT